MNNEEQTIIAPLGQALKDARLSISLTAKEVAVQLNLSVSTIQEIEEDLGSVLEHQKYPTIYLRGYIYNYAKLVALDNLDQFFEYRQLLENQKHPQNLHPAMTVSPHKKRLKRLILWFLLIMAVAVCALIAQPFFFNESKTEPAELHGENLTDENALEDNALSRHGDGSRDATEDSAESDESEIVAVQLEEQNPFVPRDEMTKKPMAPPLTAEVKSDTLSSETVVDNKTETINSQAVVPILAEKSALATTAAVESLTLTYSEDCWTEIMDATGKRLAFDLYKKGRLLTVQGLAPFQLKLGDPSAVAIEYQDKVFEHEFVAGHTMRFRIPK